MITRSSSLLCYQLQYSFAARQTCDSFRASLLPCTQLHQAIIEMKGDI